MGRALLARPKLVVGPDQLEISHPLVLSAKAVIPLTDVRAVSVDEGAPGEHGRFPLAPEPPDRLYVRAWRGLRRRSPLPTLAVEPESEVPNRLVLFHSPRDFRPRKVRGLLRVVDNPRPGRRERGLFLRVSDPQATLDLFRRRGVRTDLDASDLAYVAPLTTV